MLQSWATWMKITLTVPLTWYDQVSRALPSRSGTFIHNCAVIQGTADVNKELTEDELQKTMDFLRHVFIPIEPSTQAAVNARMDRNILSVQGPVLTQSQIDQLVGKDAEARLYLQKGILLSPQISRVTHSPLTDQLILEGQWRICITALPN